MINERSLEVTFEERDFRVNVSPSKVNSHRRHRRLRHHRHHRHHRRQRPI